MPQCSSYGCNTMGGFCFPKCPESRRKWVIAVNRKNFTPTNASRLCEKHFKPSDFYGEGYSTGLMPKIRRLRKGVVPSIFSWKKPDKDSPIEEGFPIARQSMQAITNITDNDSCSVKSEPVWYKKEAISLVEVDLYTQADELLKEVAHQPSEVLHTHVASKHTQTESSIDLATVSILNFKNNPEAIFFYTGLSSYAKFMRVFHTFGPAVHQLTYEWSQVICISAEDQFFLTLMRLRRNTSDFELSMFFGISKTMVFNIIVTWINFIAIQWSHLDAWPPKNLVEQYLPEMFCCSNTKTSLVIDGAPNTTLLKNCRQQVHIERLIGLKKTYKILKSKLNDYYVPLGSRIVSICYLLSNFNKTAMQMINVGLDDTISTKT